MCYMDSKFWLNVGAPLQRMAKSGHPSKNYLLPNGNFRTVSYVIIKHKICHLHFSSYSSYLGLEHSFVFTFIW